MLEVNKIYNMDCVDGMKMLDDCCIDLTVTSPPYDSLREYKGFCFNFEDTANELFRVTKPGGVVVWVVGDSCENGDESCQSFIQALAFRKIGFNLFDTMIYHKYGTPMRGSLKGYNQCFEYMFVFTKGEIKTFNIIMDRKNVSAGLSRETTNRRPDGQVNNQGVCVTGEFGRRENVWSYTNGFMQTSKDQFAFKHPAIFPEKLAEDHILSWSNPGDIVLDPFMGSGTTAKMAKNNQRKYIGFEISSEYCKIAEDRCRQENIFDLLDRIQEDI